jgi:hypothetical protein
MTYRRRIHSITRYSPFQVLFGGSMKHFGDWKTDEKDDQVSNLYKRSLELQQMLQLFQPEALEKNENFASSSTNKSSRKSTYDCVRCFCGGHNNFCCAQNWNHVLAVLTLSVRKCQFQLQDQKCSRHNLENSIPTLQTQSCKFTR